MCRFKSGIILRNKIVLAPEGNESHSDLLYGLRIEDTTWGAENLFVRAELIPKDGNKASDISEWRYIVDQDVIPDWYQYNSEEYEQKFRDAVCEYMKDRITVICGYAWTAIKEDKKGTYYLMDGSLGFSDFGETSNYEFSYVRNMLLRSCLAKKLKESYGDRLVPIETDLSMGGYGILKEDILAIPTIALYRECSERIPLLANKLWWLADTQYKYTAYCADHFMMDHSYNGLISQEDIDSSCAVRPYIILKPEHN